MAVVPKHVFSTEPDGLGSRRTGETAWAAVVVWLTQGLELGREDGVTIISVIGVIALLQRCPLLARDLTHFDVFFYRLLLYIRVCVRQAVLHIL